VGQGRPYSRISSPTLSIREAKEMRKKSIFLLIVALFIISCKRDERNSSLRTEIIGGIEHVYNTGKPLKGQTPLEVTEILRIEPSEIDQDNPPLFETAVKDDLGNLYLADHQNVRIYRFDSGGQLVAQFLRKGQGPGEFPGFSDVQLVDNHVWVIGTWPLKIAKFTLEGQFVNEWMFRTFRNFYLRTQVISEDHFLTVSYRDAAGNKDRLRVSALMNSREESLTQYYDVGDGGIFRIRTGQQEGPALASSSPLIAADIHHAYDRDSGTIFVCNNREYEIVAKNFDGTNKLVIHKDYEKIGLDQAAKENILQMIAPRIPPEAKQSAIEQLPPALNAIWGMTVIPGGYLAVKRITGLESVEIDLFDKEGRLLYTILPSAEIPDLRAVTIFGNTIGVVSELAEKDIFVEYKVKNIRGILD
jgi:6-bladed beta-propeller